MKYLLTLLCFLVACNSQLIGEEPPAPPLPKSQSVNKATPYKDYHKRVFKLDAGGRSASGFAYNKNLIITAAHFCANLDDDESVSVRIHYVNKRGKVNFLKKGKVEKKSKKKDVCTIRKNDHGLLTLPLTKKYKDVKVMDKVIVGGAPFGYFPYLDEGYVMNPRARFDDERFDKTLLIKATGTYGISGGPVINRDGEVIGIAQAKHPNFDDVLLAVKSSKIKMFMSDHYGK